MVPILREDMDATLEVTGTEQKSVPIELDEHIVFDSLFKPYAEPQHKPRVLAKTHYYSRTTNAEDDTHARKKEKTGLEATRRAS